jgi:hypothetical protein
LEKMSQTNSKKRTNPKELQLTVKRPRRSRDVVPGWKLKGLAKKQRAKAAGYVTVYYDKWDMNEVTRLLQELPEGHHDIPTLRHVSAVADPQGCIEVKYRHGRGLTFGRVYAKHSFQNVTTNTRNRCGGKFYKDFDAVNCYPTLMNQIFQKAGIECKLLSAYVTDRERIIADILNRNPQLDRSTIKLAFIIALHCGNYTRHATDGLKIKELDEFMKGIRTAVTSLKTKSGYAELYLKTERHPGKDNPTGTFIAWACQIVESQIIGAFADFVKESGGTIDVNMFDGLMV